MPQRRRQLRVVRLIIRCGQALFGGGAAQFGLFLFRPLLFRRADFYLHFAHLPAYRLPGREQPRRANPQPRRRRIVACITNQNPVSAPPPPTIVLLFV